MIFSPGFLLHSKRKQIQKKKHLNPASKNYRILSCFCCLLCGCVAFWSRLSRLLCVALRDLLNARGFFNHSIAFDFADVFLFVVVWCCFSFSYLRTFQLGYRAISQSNCQFWFEFRSLFFFCFVLIMIELLLPNYLILNFCFANQKGQTEKGVSCSV